MDLFELVTQQWQQQSIGEIIAVLLALAYVWLAAEESLWCWPAGFLSTSLYAYIYWDVSLVFQMLLNIYYMAMAVWGFLSWRKVGSNKLVISSMSLNKHIMAIGIGTLGTAVVFLIVRQWLHYELVLLDIGLSIFSLVATYLTVKKELENWYYWTFINVITIALLWQSQLYLTVILMLFYVVLAMRGLYHWTKVYQQKDAYSV